MDTTLELQVWKTAQYHRMIAMGIFDAEPRVELIAGQVIKMAAKGVAHTAATKRTDRLLKHLLGDRALVQIQDPIQIDDYSEPEPDIAVVKTSPVDYSDRHPLPSEVYLIIEIAATSLKIDCETKAKLYAQAGIPEYWVLDVINRELYVLRASDQRGYNQQRILKADQRLSILAFPDLAIAIKDMLPLV